MLYELKYGNRNFYKPITRLKSHQCLVTGHVFAYLNCTHLPISQEAAHCQELKCGPLSKFLLMLVPPGKAELRPSLLAPVGFARKRLLCHVVRWGKKCLSHGCWKTPRVSCALHSDSVLSAAGLGILQQSLQVISAGIETAAVAIAAVSTRATHWPQSRCFSAFCDKVTTVRRTSCTHTQLYIHICLEFHRICI